MPPSIRIQALAVRASLPFVLVCGGGQRLGLAGGAGADPLLRLSITCAAQG